MILKAIGGISVNELTETEKEIAAKALECGYLRKSGNIIEPKIIVIDRKNATDFYNLSLTSTMLWEPSSIKSPQSYPSL